MSPRRSCGLPVSSPFSLVPRYLILLSALNPENLAMAYGSENPRKRSNSILSTSFHDALLEGRSVQATKNIHSYMVEYNDHPGKPNLPVGTTDFDATCSYNTNLYLPPGFNIPTNFNTNSSFGVASGSGMASNFHTPSGFGVASGSNTTSHFNGTYGFSNVASHVNISSMDNHDDTSSESFANVPSGSTSFHGLNGVYPASVPGAFEHGVNDYRGTLNNNGAGFVMGASGPDSGSSSQSPAGSRKKPRTKKSKVKPSKATTVEPADTYDVSAALRALMKQVDDEENDNSEMPMGADNGSASGKLVESGDVN